MKEKFCYFFIEKILTHNDLSNISIVLNVGTLD